MMRSRALLGALLALCMALLASGCAAPSSYYGIDLTAPALTDEERAIQSLASRAQAGDKQAQLDLGIRFEEGHGVERDLDKAIKLYALASIDTGGTVWVYTPPIGNNGNGNLIPVDTGPEQPGLAEAKRRLEQLK